MIYKIWMIGLGIGTIGQAWSIVTFSIMGVDVWHELPVRTFSNWCLGITMAWILIGFFYLIIRYHERSEDK